MSGSSFVVPSAVFSGLSGLSGPVAVVGSRSLPSAALLSVARFGRWVGRSRPLWSGGALGVDCAASAGALAQGGQVRWWLPAGFGELPVGSSSPVVRGPGGVFPVSAPRHLARSVRCVAWGGGPSSASFSTRLFQRSVSLLLSLRGAGGGSVVCFIAQSALAAQRGGSWFTVRRALGLGFRPGVSLFVLVVGPAGFQLFVAGCCCVCLFRSFLPLSCLCFLPSSWWVRVRLSSRLCVLLGPVAILMASGLILSPCVARSLSPSGSGSGMVRVSGPFAAIHVSHVWR